MYNYLTKNVVTQTKAKSLSLCSAESGGFDIGSIMALEAGSGRVGHRPLVATQPNATEEAFLFVARVAIVAFFLGHWTSCFTDQIRSADGDPSPIPAKHLERRTLACLHRHVHPRRSRHRPPCHRPLLLNFSTRDLVGIYGISHLTGTGSSDYD